MKLGKQEYKFDKRTVKMARFLDMTLRAPVKFDFDADRRAIPIRMWGNDAYGDCVFAGQMNGLLRMERVETRHTLPVDDSSVISTYKVLTGCRAPDDANDRGFVMLDALNWWRQQGWTIRSRNYKIEAFGELDPSDDHQLRLACYLLHGVQFGFALPISAQRQMQRGYWDVVPGGSETRPGSWGGHAVYGKRFDADNFHVLTWGREIKVSNAFVEKYCDEAWAVVDSLNQWRKHDAFDVDKLVRYLNEIGAIKR